jgi:hypothetical protein
MKNEIGKKKGLNGAGPILAHSLTSPTRSSG